MRGAGTRRWEHVTSNRVVGSADALSTRRIVTHFEPDVMLDTGALVGFEALDRWTDPERATVPPSEFIPVAEERATLAEPALARARVIATTAAPGRAALVHPAVDAWLLGGASVVVWALFAVLDPLRSVVPRVGTHLDNVVFVAASLSLVVNYPHFMASYRIAYGRGLGYVLDRWFCLVVVPAVLFVTLCTAWATTGHTLHLLSADVDRVGERLLGWSVQLLFLTVGWHYTKQAYGCSRAGAQYRGFTISPGQAIALRYGLFPLWVALWVRSNALIGEHEYLGLRYAAVGVPSWTIPVTDLAIAIGAVAVTSALARAAWSNGCRPPALVVAPLVAMFVWWVPATYNPVFAILVPFFHSLQYLPFVARVEVSRHRRRRARSATRQGVVVAAALMLTGWIAFELAPGAIDHANGRDDGVLVALLVVTVFINVHHYFIDHVAWRLRDPAVRADLLG
jgi:hypothetical protein